MFKVILNNKLGEKKGYEKKLLKMCNAKTNRMCKAVNFEEEEDYVIDDPTKDSVKIIPGNAGIINNPWHIDIKLPKTVECIFKPGEERPIGIRQIKSGMRLWFPNGKFAWELEIRMEGDDNRIEQTTNVDIGDG